MTFGKIGFGLSLVPGALFLLTIVCTATGVPGFG